MLMNKIWIAEERKDKTVYRRRCRPGTSEVLLSLFVAVCALIFLLVCSILYGTRTENASLLPLVKEYLPAGRCACEFSANFACDTCLDCVSNQLALASDVPAFGQPKSWIYHYPRDRNNVGLNDQQCQIAFPGQYEDVDRAFRLRRRLGKVSEAELSSLELGRGMVRAMIYDGKLYIIETHLVDNINRQKALASLSAVHRALVAAPVSSETPNIEFVFSIDDLPAQLTRPMWSLVRRVQDHNLWLIPDFGFWSWDMPALGTLDEIATEAARRESIESWDQKIEKLVWRGKITYAPKLRRALLDAAKSQPWSAVEQLKWTDSSFREQFMGPVDQCSYMFIAHAEGRSYSASLKYRQLCRSVVVSHKLQWIQHYHYLMRSNGTHQNFVEVERNFSNLSSAMEDLLDHPEKAKRIADNSVRVFRERYLTQAAEACYWRYLIKRWKEVMAWEPQLYSGREAGDQLRRGQKRGVRFETFMLYEPRTQMEWPERV